MNPAFLEAVSRCAGGKSAPERRAALLEYTEQAVRQGTVGRPWERLVAGLVLGSEAFAQRLRRGLAGNAREQSAFRRLVPGIKWRRIVSELEHIRGEDWAVFSHRHGDWGRDAALRLGRRHGRYRLRELGELAGGRPGGQPVWPAPAAATATPAEDRES